MGSKRLTGRPDSGERSVIPIVGGSHPKPISLREIVRIGWNRLMESRALTLLGAMGILLGVCCAAIFALRHGAPIPPEGDLTKAASFDIAVGIYVLTVALLLPSAGFSERGRRRWVAWNVALFLYGYSIETIQILRGLDPRFTRVGTPVDQILGLVFFLVALTIIVMFVIMVVRFFRPDCADKDSPVLLAIRYGCVAAMGAFAAGIWMSLSGGRRAGEAGNILSLHALGFHGLQAVPIVALLLNWSSADNLETRKWVHVTGISWLVACAAVAWQTFIGRSVFDVTPATLVTAFVLAVWSAIAAFSYWRWAQAPILRESPDISRTPR